MDGFCETLILEKAHSNFTAHERLDRPEHELMDGEIKERSSFWGFSEVSIRSLQVS